jgi:hypothetical protein
MCDEPKIITVGKSHPAPDVAKWLREQPHDRRIILVCRDEPSVKEEFPIRPSAFRCIDVGVESLVVCPSGEKRLAVARVQIADTIASDPALLFKTVLEEAAAAFADLRASDEVQISDK